MTEEKKVKGTLTITIDRKTVQMEAPEPKPMRPISKPKKEES